jgi:hypothetical protein
VIEVKENDYIIGIWLVQRYNFGKVYIYSVRGEKDNEFIIYLKYIYDQQRYNVYMSDNDHKNTFTKSNISEIDTIKICNDKAGELGILFCHKKYKILIGGDKDRYLEIMAKTSWLPPIILFPKTKLKELKKSKERTKYD